MPMYVGMNAQWGFSTILFLIHKPIPPPPKKRLFLECLSGVGLNVMQTLADRKENQQLLPSFHKQKF